VRVFTSIEVFAGWGWHTNYGFRSPILANEVTATGIRQRRYFSRLLICLCRRWKPGFYVCQVNVGRRRFPAFWRFRGVVRAILVKETLPQLNSFCENSAGKIISSPESSLSRKKSRTPPG